MIPPSSLSLFQNSLYALMSRPQQYPDSSEPSWYLSLILTPPSSSSLLANLRLPLEGWRATGAPSFSSTLPPSFKDHFLYCSFQDSQSAERRVSCWKFRAGKRAHRAQLQSFDNRLWGTTGGWEGRVQKDKKLTTKGALPPPSLHTPPEAIPQAFVDSDLKREALAAAGGWSLTICSNAECVFRNLNTAPEDMRGKKKITIHPAPRWTPSPFQCFINERVW